VTTTDKDELIRISPELIAAYEATHYEVEAPGGKEVIRIGHPVPEVIQALMLPWDKLAVVTAFNPFSIPLSKEENLRRHEVLRGVVEAAGRRMLFGEGRDAAGKWDSETSIAIFDATDDELDDWMLAFGQNAIVVATRGGLPELRLHPYAALVTSDAHAGERDDQGLRSHE